MLRTNWGRRCLKTWLVMAVLAISLPLSAGLFSPEPVAAQDAASIQPQVYVDQTGQLVSGPFLKAWPNWGGPDGIGFPVSSVQQQGEQQWTQWFESVRLVISGKSSLAEAAPEDVQIAPLGLEYARSQGYFNNNPAFDSKLSVGEGARYFLVTRHTLANAFRDWWEKDDHSSWAGLPISEEFSLNGTTYQFFENIALTWTPETGVQLAPLGTMDALARGLLAQKQAKPEGVQSYYEGYFLAAGLIVGERWIEVNLSTYTLTAWVGNTVYLQAPVVVGMAELPTVTGMFNTYWKLVTQDMEGPNLDGTEYFQEDVPWVMYFYQDYAIHGAYWRYTFGHAGSHGCVNLPVPVSKQLYAWAPLGTRVWVHY